MLAIVVAAGGYVGYVAIRHTRPVTLPVPTGQYAVGRTTFDWTDSTRTDPIAPQAGNPRELSVWLWYPAPPGTTGPRAPYAPGAWSGLHLPGLIGLAETSFGAVRNHALDRVPVAAGQFPVVVLEPGLGFAVPQYTTIAEDLASHGYLVAGVTPTYSANLTVLHGGAVHSSPAGNPSAFDDADLHAGAAQEAGDRLVQVWSADVRFTAGQVAGLGRAGEFAGHVDANHTVYIGHSFGGAAAMQACHDDPRCTGAANLDGTQFGPVVHSGLDRPTLTMASEDSCVTGACQPASVADRSDQATARALLAASTGSTFRYQITGMRHFNFTDYATYYLAGPLRSQLALGSIDGDHGLAITTAYLTVFLEHILRDRPEPLLTNPDPRYPQVKIL
ncbi:alpha/beta hydrolase family protein [Dactylosporangium sp. NPDC048998]|uniref:alpha/beta hydrolase family protein n=1 Tax=Dactylosporangium sp. NPDC048998 TaxID=3363976 RepID=UPI00372169AC